MAAIFWKWKFFLKNVQSILLRYTVGQKFHRNRSILHGLGDTSNFKFYHFCQKFKMAAIFGTLWLKNFVEIALSRMV